MPEHTGYAGMIILINEDGSSHILKRHYQPVCADILKLLQDPTWLGVGTGPTQEDPPAYLALQPGMTFRPTQETLEDCVVGPDYVREATNQESESGVFFDQLVREGKIQKSSATITFPSAGEYQKQIKEQRSYNKGKADA